MLSYVRIFSTYLVVFCASPIFASSIQYAIIIDAGSSGSRAHVFEYEKAGAMLAVPVIKDVFNQSTTPGLSFFANNPTTAGASLKPILNAAVLYLAEKKVNLSEVPVSVLATAGMRLLPPLEQEAIYASVSDYIKNNYAFVLNTNDVRTITGAQEGIFGWLDVNYLQNNFTNFAKTIGSIDMGGASTQIAFATTDTSRPENEEVITINNTPYRVFSISFLGLGQDQSRQTMMTDYNSPSCNPNGYFYNSQIGNFNFLMCSSIYTRIIQDQNVVTSIIPTTGYKFIAYSGIYYDYSFFNILNTPTQSALQSQINAICYLPWSTLKSNYPNTPVEFLANYCANGVYFDDLLYNTYHLQDSQLTITNQINGTGIDWTLGALLYGLVQA